MGKTRDLFKKYQGNISCKDGLDKGQKWYGPNRAEDIKKRWQEYTEDLYKKGLHETDNHDGVITHLEPDILECKVNWVLGSNTMNKASGGDQFWKTQQWPQDWKRSVFIPIPKKGNAKECSNYRNNCICVFLPPLLNIFCSVRSIPFLSFIEPIFEIGRASCRERV